MRLDSILARKAILGVKQMGDSRQMVRTPSSALWEHIPRRVFGDVRRLVALAWLQIGQRDSLPGSKTRRPQSESPCRYIHTGCTIPQRRGRYTIWSWYSFGSVTRVARAAHQWPEADFRQSGNSGGFTTLVPSDPAAPVGAAGLSRADAGRQAMDWIPVHDACLRRVLSTPASSRLPAPGCSRSR